MLSARKTYMLIKQRASFLVSSYRYIALLIALVSARKTYKRFLDCKSKTAMQLLLRNPHDRKTWLEVEKKKKEKIFEFLRFSNYN